MIETFLDVSFRTALMLPHKLLILL